MCACGYVYSLNIQSVFQQPPQLRDLFNSKCLSERNSPADPELHPSRKMKPAPQGGVREKGRSGEREREGEMCRSGNRIILLFVIAALVVTVCYWTLIKMETILIIGN